VVLNVIPVVPVLVTVVTVVLMAVTLRGGFTSNHEEQQMRVRTPSIYALPPFTHSLHLRTPGAGVGVTTVHNEPGVSRT
jgi:hypothetical protein